MTSVTPHVLAFGYVDYFIIVIILASTLISLLRGFTSEAVSLLTWIIAAIFAFKLSHPLSDRLAGMIHTPSVRFLVSFLILFIIVLIIGSIINHFFGMLIKSTGLSGTNRLLGMIFGFARGVLLVAIFILFANMTSIVREPWWQSSYLIPLFDGLVAWLQQFIPNHFNGMSHYFANPKAGSP